MERRLAILQKHSRSRYDTADSDSPHNLSAGENNALYDSVASSLTPRMRVHRDSVINSETRSRSNSNDHVSRTGRSSRVSSHSSTPIPQDMPESANSGSTKRNAKRKLSENLTIETSSKKRRPKQAEVRTKIEYEGLNLTLPPDLTDGYVVPCDGNHFGSSRRNSADLANSVASSSVSGHSGDGEKAVLNGTDHTILVPSWRTQIVKPNADVDPSNDCEVGMVVQCYQHCCSNALTVVM